ncbi:uncharacterized protein LAESUDRAFT_716477 [Laetiporus sulphureus 93-53]|uniref:GED domain-containing protein n=1 Tax=Laetiporus sulphureus 93-53 TaxID=1314785 RepID=A0A165CMZ3_9APHY|nr:uncharacterized protein LAESUDRAFT_716477 [Laetiporus sulphureus 93-53]KZT03105.1 hypothetical protein LAESUDRAFT_716477 [Laetiporus sulphureus 93-53]
MCDKLPGISKNEAEMKPAEEAKTKGVASEGKVRVCFVSILPLQLSLIVKKAEGHREVAETEEKDDYDDDDDDGDDDDYNKGETLVLFDSSSSTSGTSKATIQEKSIISLLHSTYNSVICDVAMSASMFDTVPMTIQRDLNPELVDGLYNRIVSKLDLSNADTPQRLSKRLDGDSAVKALRVQLVRTKKRLEDVQAKLNNFVL